MTKEPSMFEQVFFGDPNRAEREEKVLRYVIHRIGEDANLHEVLREPYVHRNCSQPEIDHYRLRDHDHLQDQRERTGAGSTPPAYW